MPVNYPRVSAARNGELRPTRRSPACPAGERALPRRVTRPGQHRNAGRPYRLINANGLLDFRR